MRPDTKNILEFHGIHKSFFGVPVLREVSFSLCRGRILGLIGENGAGKSTLMNILGGVLAPDKGRMILAGRDYLPRNPRDAALLGVAFIHQELNLFPNLSIAENLHVPSFPRRRLGPLVLPLVSYRTMRHRTVQLLDAVQLERDPRTPVERLSPGERQLVEIAKAIGSESQLVILDEPTTSLTAHETERLFSLLQTLRRSGVSMIYISHRLGEIQRLCDDLVILRDGQIVGDGPCGQFTPDRMISLMVGRSIDQLFPPRHAAPGGEIVLQVRGLSRPRAVHGIDLALRRGEVLGLAGLVGAGRTELARLIFGLDPIHCGEVLLRGQPIRPSPSRSVRKGLALVTENRREEGLLMDASITENIALVALPRHAHAPIWWIDRRSLGQAVAQALSSMRLAAADPQRQPVRTLSGGNQQKVVLAKWLLADPCVFILDEPTRGVDVGAKHEIYRLINSLADAGAGVLLIASEIEELLGMCDRILVMCRGRIVDAMDRANFDRERILRSALGEETAP